MRTPTKEEKRKLRVAAVAYAEALDRCEREEPREKDHPALRALLAAGEALERAAVEFQGFTAITVAAPGKGGADEN